MLHGLQAQISYTYSKALDNGSVTSGLEQVNGSQGPYENPYDINQDYGRSIFDRTHNLHLSGIYVLPFKGSLLLSGYQVSGIFSAVSGIPYSLQSGFDQAGLGFSNANERPNFLPGRTSAGSTLHSAAKWCDPTAFTLPGVGLLGTSQRNSMIGPRLFDTDLSFSKKTGIPALSELFAVELRGEFFNIFNHTNFGLPSTNVFTSTGNGNGTFAGTAGSITSTLTSNGQIQLAVRFTFWWALPPGWRQPSSS